MKAKCARRTVRCRTAKRRNKPSKKLSFFEKVLAAFNQLEGSEQAVLIIGCLLLLAWIVSHPDILQGIIRALQLWFAIKGTISHLLR